MRPFEWWLLAGLGAAFAPALLALARVWQGVDYYSHGFLVPLVALGVGLQPPRPRAREPRERRGATVVALALALYAAGLGVGSVSLQGLALVGAVAGCVLFVSGAPGLAALAFPVGFLLFMVPLPEAWLAPVILRLQLGVSATAATLLPLLGVEVARHGNVLVLPGELSLFVAEACSGITSIVTLTPLAVVLGYLTERGWRRRALIVACVVPLAMLGNLLRVLGTVFAARAFGVEPATEGPLHELAGVASFALSVGLLIAVGVGLRALAPPQREV